MTLANSGLPYPIRSSADGCSQIELPGVPLGSFHGSMYDELSFALNAGDVFVFCTDGVFEAMNGEGQEFTAARLLDVVQRSRDLPAARLVEAIFAAVHEWRGDTPPNDDMTAVVVRITA
jgi:serine phosphatase RsbU (regulator of sigma subunit)